jgi:hypothetical protein
MSERRSENLIGWEGFYGSGIAQLRKKKESVPA